MPSAQDGTGRLSLLSNVTCLYPREGLQMTLNLKQGIFVGRQYLVFTLIASAVARFWNPTNVRKTLCLPIIFALLLIAGSAQEKNWFRQQSRGEPNQLFPMQLNDRTGFINIKGEIVIAPQFDYAHRFHNGLALVQINGKNVSQTKRSTYYTGGKYGYIDKTGKFVIEAKFIIAQDFSEGLAAVGMPTRNGGRSFGYIDTTGRMVIKPRFQEAGDFNEGTASVRVNDKWGVIDRRGKFIIPPKYDLVDSFIEGIGMAYRDRNEEPHILATNYFEFPAPPNPGIVLFDKKGRVIGTFKFFPFGSYAEGLITVQVAKNAFGFLDKTGKLVVEPQFERADNFSEGLCPVRINEKWGYIDKTGRIVIEPKYDWARKFSEGLGRVTIGAKTGFIDKTGNMVIEPEEQDVYDFADGLAVVWEKGNERGYIDKTGKFVWKTIIPTN